MFIILLLFITIFPSISSAAVYYVRDGGGTFAQCNGLTNHVLSGATGVNCAWNHPRIALGYNCLNGGNSCAAAGHITGGDTVNIVGDSDTSPGTQAQYKIGYDTGGATNGCNASGSYDCTLGNIPAGASTSAKTIIIGIGVNKPQLWGTERVWQVINNTRDNTDVENLEITDHSACSENGPIAGTVDGFPTNCNRSSSPYGPWASQGMYFGGSNKVTKNLWIHGVAHEAIYFNVNVTNWVSNNDKITGAAFSATNGSTAFTFGGNNSLTNDVFDYGGCAEHYPLVNTDYRSTLNYHTCYGQGLGGYGDGFVMPNQNVLPNSCGNWTITNSEFSFNQQDGFDFLHCDGTGTISFYRSRAEGNIGQAFKTNNAVVNFENSQAVGDCAFFRTSGIESTKNTSGVSATENYCRANGDTLVFSMTNATIANVINSDIIGSGADLIITNGSTCNANTKVFSYNNKFIGGRNWLQDTSYNAGGDNSLVNYYFAAGSGACATVPIVDDYNDVFNTKNSNANCTGTHSKCGTNPLVSGTLTQGPINYYTGTNYGDQLYLQSSSTLRGAANTGVTLTGTANDYNNFSRSSSWDMGGLQYTSCVATNFQCSSDSQCCAGTCSTGACVGSCTANTNACAINSDCCSNNCVGLVCQAACTVNGNSCSSSANCCSGNCCNNLCTASACSAVCGNNIVETPEQCDTGASVGTGGCSSSCTINQGYSCTGNPSVCVLNSCVPDFTLFTKSDPSMQLGVLAATTTFTGIDRNQTVYLRNDYGASHFTNFTHQFSATVSSCSGNIAGGDNAILGLWGLSANAQSGLNGMNTNNDGLNFYYACLNGVNRWVLSSPQGSLVESLYQDSSPPQTRYIRITRSGSSVSANIYSDSSFSTILSTLTLTNSTPYRYLYTTAAYNSGDSGTSESGNVTTMTLSGGNFQSCSANSDCCGGNCCSNVCSSTTCNISVPGGTGSGAINRGKIAVIGKCAIR